MEKVLIPFLPKWTVMSRYTFVPLFVGVYQANGSVSGILC